MTVRRRPLLHTTLRSVTLASTITAILHILSYGLWILLYEVPYSVGPVLLSQADVVIR